MTGKTLSQQFASATLCNAIMFPARLGVGIVASVVFYQKLSVDQAGILMILQSIAVSVGLYADLGIERTLPRFLPEVEREAGRTGVERLMTKIVRVKLLVLLALVAALAVFTTPAVRYLGDKPRKEITVLEQKVPRNDAEAEDIAQKVKANRSVLKELETRGGMFLGAVGLLLLLGALFDVYMQFLTAYLKQRSWNLITLASTILQPVLVTAFILARWQITGALLGLVIAPLISVLLAAWQVSRASRELRHVPSAGKVDRALQARFVRFSAVNYFMQITTWVYSKECVVLLFAATLSLEDVAFLGFAYKLTQDLLSYVWTPLTGVTTPVLSRVHVRGEPHSLQEAHAALTRIIWLTLVPAGVGLLVLTPRILQAFYPKYTSTAGLVSVFIVFTFGESLLSVPQNVLMVAEKYKPVILARFVAFLTIPLVFLLLPRYGILGVAVAAGSARLLSRGVTLLWGSRDLGLVFPTRYALKVVAASGVMAAALLVALSSAGVSSIAGLQGALSSLGLFAAGDHRAQRLASLADAALWALAGSIVFALALKAMGGLHEDDRRRILALPKPWARAVGRLL